VGEHRRPGRPVRPRRLGRLVIAAVVGTLLTGTAFVGLGVGTGAAEPAPTGDGTAVRVADVPPLPGVGGADPGGAAPAAPDLPALPANPIDPVDGTPQTAEVEQGAEKVDKDDDGSARPAPEPPRSQTVDGGVRIPGTPCSGQVQACVDLTTLKAWLIIDGEVRRGPMDIRIGDEFGPTPVGRFQVQWKDEDHVSTEYGTPMRWAVFFADGGVAFHEGRQDTDSAGCVKLTRDDARAMFYALQVDDGVQIVRTVTR